MKFISTAPLETSITKFIAINYDYRAELYKLQTLYTTNYDTERFKKKNDRENKNRAFTELLLSLTAALFPLME